MSELTIGELEQLATAETGRDYARERRENTEALRLCDELELLDKEGAADSVEDVLAFWNDPLTGLPTLGESPRFRTDRERQYMDWVTSKAGERTRQNVHPKTAERMRREEQ